VKSTRRFLIAAAVVLGLAVASVGIAYAITGGQPDGDGHPYVGLVVFYNADGVPIWRCSGTLLSPTVFLTAGHCTDGAESAQVWFDEGPIPWGTYPTPRPTPAPSCTVHTGYPCEGGYMGTPETHSDYRWGPTSNPHDVGVVILDPAVDDITPAILPDEGFLDQLRKDGELRKGREGAKFTVVGYGVTLHWPPPVYTAELQRQFAESEYLKLLKAWLLMSQNQAPGRDDGGTCGGDSGGPAFWTDPDDPDGEEILVGITSWGDMPCVATGFNYRVDIPETLDFISGYMTP